MPRDRRPRTEQHIVIHPREGTGIAGLTELEKVYVDLLLAFAVAAG